MSTTESGTEFVTVDGARVQLPIEMADDMLATIIAIVKESTVRFDVDQQGAAAAELIKTRLDEQFNPHWHVAVGNGFGSYVVHEQRAFVYFYLGTRAYLIYKSGRN